MIKRGYKVILSVILITTLLLCFVVSGYAVGPGSGLLIPALGELGVDLLAGGGAGLASLALWLSDDFDLIGVITGVADGYIKVGEESVTIDGVVYDSIFLDPSLASELHTQAFDFITQKAITDNSSGILATGAGYCGGIAMYNINGVIRSQDFVFSYPVPDSGRIPYSIGDFDVFYVSTSLGVETPEPRYRCYVHESLTSGGTLAGTVPRADTSSFVRIEAGRYGSTYGYVTKIGPNLINFGTTRQLVEDPFNYSYVSGQIDINPLPSDYGFQAFIPRNAITGAGINPGTYVIDGGAGEDTIIELLQLIDELLDDEEVKEAEFTPVLDPPIPPQPIPTDALGAIPYDEWIDTFGQSVYGRLDSIDDGIDTVGNIIAGAGEDVVDVIDTYGQSVVTGLDSIETAIDSAGQSVTDGLSDVETAIGSAEQSITDSVDAVAEKVDALDTTVDEVIEKIESHPLDLFSAFLDRLTNIPVIRDMFDGIKRHVGIWHYVVEWLQCIGSFLAFFIGLFADVAYCMVVPIYACVAGAICLAFYKRFGR